MDNKIKTALENAVKDIDPKEDMLFKITNDYKKECLKMKKVKPFKAILACAVTITALTAITVVSIGAGKAAYTSGHSSHAEEIQHYPTLKELGEIIDFDPVYPQKIGNYEYESCVPTHNTDKDENGNALMDYTGMSFHYKTDKGLLNLSADPKLVNASEDGEEFEYNGIKMYYSSEVYKFVPPDYELTEEDKALQDSGEIMISYGSSEIEIKNMQAVVWNMDDVGYCLLGMDIPEDKEAFISMAKQVVDERE